VKSSGKDSRATGGLISNLPHPWMIMIAFVALNSSLRFSTLLIEGQCSSNPFKVKSIVTLKSLAFLFWKEKYVHEK